MKTMFMFFMLGLLCGINSSEMIIRMEQHPIMFRTIGIMLLVYLIIDFIQTILRVIKTIRKTKFTRVMMKKFEQARMETVKDI